MLRAVRSLPTIVLCLFALSLSPGLDDRLRASATNQRTVSSNRGMVSLRWVAGTRPKEFVVEVHGLNSAQLRRISRLGWTQADWQRVLAVHVDRQAAAREAQLPAMAGSYHNDGDVLRFEPRFPLEAGVTYRAVFRPSGFWRRQGVGSAGEPISSIFHAPSLSPTPTTRVKAIYPSAALLPENLLKFYVHFSAAMNRGQVYDHISLIDGAGREIDLPFLEIGEELWDPRMLRLTLIIDPGRIKRGVLPLAEVGAALEEGKSYRLIIGRDLRDSNGKILDGDFEKAFQVGPPDREPPDPASWRISPPASGTREPLLVVFPEPMDQALAQRVIQVTSESGQVVQGEVSLEEGERVWRFVPTAVWPQGNFMLVTQKTIEDLSGNNIGKPFDVDLFEGVDRRLSAESIKLPFRVR